MKINYIHLQRMADVTIGATLALDANDGIKSMKDFKAQIKEAKGDLVAMSEQFGVTSEEARKAAKRVAELEDALGDAKQLSDAFNPDKKFTALSQSLQGVLGGFTALTGAMGLLGVESEDVQKQLLKVQSALALGQGLDQVKDSINSFKTLGKTLVENLGKGGLAGVAIAGVTALGLALAGVFSKSQSESVKAYNESLKEYNRIASQARQTVTEVKIAFEQARAGVINKEQALKVYNETLGDSLGKANNINDAEKILAEKADTYIKVTALKAQANYLFSKSAEKAAEALLAQDALTSSGKDLKIAGLNVTQTLLKKVNEQISEAQKIEDKAADLLRQAGALSQSASINTGGSAGSVNKPSATFKSRSGGSSSSKVEQAKKDEEEIRGIELLMAERAAKRRDDELAALEATKNRKLEINNELTASAKSYADSIDYYYNQQIEASKLLAEQSEMERQARVQAAYDIGGALSALSELIGKQTAAGKVLAIAQAGINMWLGVTEVLRTKSTLPEPIATISRIANITTVIATGLSAIKNIAKQNVGGGSGGGVSAQAPLQPQAQSTNTLLNQNQLNQIGNAASRAFVLETDVTNNQERIRRLNRAARLG